ncbi:MAG: hypothetical protein K1X86_07905 [Ignavibacteria bacterium]|nr:hypothetical protein [Ignavibacteria bacterium]
MARKLNKFSAKLNNKGRLIYNQSQLAGWFGEIRKDNDAKEEDVEVLVLSVKDKDKSKSKIKIASDKIQQVEFLSKKLNIDRNSTFLLISSFGSLKKS